MERTFFDQQGRAVRQEDGLGNPLVEIAYLSNFEYDDRNNRTKTIDARGKVTTYGYDGQNNLRSVTNPLGHSTFYTYNSRGQVIAVTDENGHPTTHTYDSFGNRTATTGALGHTNTYQYDTLGRLVKTIDPLNKVTLNEYDSGDHLVKVIENHLPGQPQNYQNEYNLVTEYIYDGAGHRVITTDPLGRVTRHEYDLAGRLSRTIQNEHPTVTELNYLNEYNLVIEYGYGCLNLSRGLTLKFEWGRGACKGSGGCLVRRQHDD